MSPALLTETSLTAKYVDLLSGGRKEKAACPFGDVVAGEERFAWKPLAEETILRGIWGVASASHPIIAGDSRPVRY